MRIIERINKLEKVLSTVKDPALLFAAGKTLEQLQNELEKIKETYKKI